MFVTDSRYIPQGNIAVKRWVFPDGSFSGSVVTATPPLRLIDTLTDHTKNRIMQYSLFEDMEPCREVWHEYVKVERSGAGWRCVPREVCEDLNRQRSLRRSARQLKNFVRFHDLRRLLTFTNGAPEGWSGRRESLDAVTLWLRQGAKREFFRDTPIVLVAERGGDNGRWHVHACVTMDAWLPYRRIIESWSGHMECSGWHSSHISQKTGKPVHRFHAGDEQRRALDGFTNAKCAAEYMGKYMTKDFLGDREKYEHIYRPSGGWSPVAEAWRSDSLRSALWAAGLASDDCYPLTIKDTDGTSHTCGYLFDTG